MPRKGKVQPYTFSSKCTVRKQAELPSLKADSQILFQISCHLLSFLEALTMLETCFFFILLPLLEKHELLEVEGVRFQNVWCYLRNQSES